MSLHIIQGDITKFSCDAIVNAAKPSLLGGGGVDGAIHKAAGKALREECKTLGGCAVGQSKITNAYNLPCKYVIHTVGPQWKGGTAGEPELLASCYWQSLLLAQQYGCNVVAFPLISAGVYGYPYDDALRIAQETIEAFLAYGSDMTVYLVLYPQANKKNKKMKFLLPAVITLVAVLALLVLLGGGKETNEETIPTVASTKTTQETYTEPEETQPPLVPPEAETQAAE